MKTSFLPALALLTLTPVVGHTEEPTTQRFEHKGSTYSYTVTRVGEVRVISGVEEETGKPFVLRVGAHRVRGTVGSQQVSFPLRDVEPRRMATATLASR